MGPRKSALSLVNSGATQGSGSRTYRTGRSIPHSGIYRVIHQQHRLPHEVTLLKDEEFPRCGKCDRAVTFELVLAAQTEREAFRDEGIRIALYELPELEAASEDSGIAA
jgi:hypothetical protein